MAENEEVQMGKYGPCCPVCGLPPNESGFRWCSCSPESKAMLAKKSELAKMLETEQEPECVCDDILWSMIRIDADRVTVFGTPHFPKLTMPVVFGRQDVFGGCVLDCPQYRIWVELQLPKQVVCFFDQLLLHEHEKREGSLPHVIGGK